MHSSAVNGLRKKHLGKMQTGYLTTVMTNAGCVCVRKRERETDRQTERERERVRVICRQVKGKIKKSNAKKGSH